jgi:SAM-dependent methyltransferase
MASALKGKLAHLYRQQQFRPGLLAIFVNPFYLARKGLIESIMPVAANIAGKTLDVGCGQKPYEHLFASSEYIGVEIDSPRNRATKRADYYYDGTRLPFADASFDSIVCNQVLEHVFPSQRLLGEIRRVLKTKGAVLLTVPFVWDEHEQPADYVRYTSFGLRALLDTEGFDIVVQRKSLTDIRVVFQPINAYIYKKTVSRYKYLNLVAAIFLMSPFNIAGSMLAMILPNNQDLYLDNVVLARKR